MSFPQYLIQLGWISHRKKFINGEFHYVLCEFNNVYSTLENGGLDFRFMKDGKEIIWGLNEKGNPPSLVYPRPDGMNEDHKVHRFINDHTNEEILNLILL